jgi:hypothetical protein
MEVLFKADVGSAEQSAIIDTTIAIIMQKCADNSIENDPRAIATLRSAIRYGLVIYPCTG